MIESNAADDASERGRELEPAPEHMTALLGEVGRRIVEYIRSLPEQPAFHSPAVSEPNPVPPEPPPEEGTALGTILDHLFGTVIPRSFNTAGPGYLAYVPGGGLFAGALAEFLAAAVNRYAGVWLAAPQAVELETQVLRWLAELLGLPRGALGVFTTGGSLSNLLAFVAAREKLVESDFLRGTAYVSTEVHHSVIKAARIAAIPRKNLRRIPVDGRFKMRLDLLEDAIRDDQRRGLKPFLLCGSAGTVNTGAVDPLAALSDVAARENLWFHVDGAYGGVFRLLPELAPALEGIERADSLAVDPHKGLFLAYGTGVLLVRNLSDLRRAYRSTGAYMPQLQEGAERIDFCDVSPELSRDWRGLRLWLPFKLHGVSAFRRALREKRELALDAFRRLSAEPDVDVAAPPELSLFAFRQRFPGQGLEEENRRNRELLERINHPRRIMITGTEISETYYLRLCVLHLRTHRKRLEEGLEIILRALAEGRES